MQRFYVIMKFRNIENWHSLKCFSVFKMFKDVQSLVDDHEYLYTVSFNTFSLTWSPSIKSQCPFLSITILEPADQWWIEQIYMKCVCAIIFVVHTIIVIGQNANRITTVQFESGIPEVLCQHLVSCQWLSMSENSKMTHRRMFCNMPY